jgi:FkbM family methyltransferase
MIEASELHQQTLQNFVQNDTNKSEFYITVLSDTNDQTVDFYDSPRANTGNSIFREHSKHFVGLKPLQKTTKTVDSIVSQSNLLQDTVVDIIKADVQGAELMVFQGASRALEQASFVQFEGSSIEWNEGGSCWHEVDVLLRSHGFYLYDMGDFLYNPGAFKTKGVGQFDVIYVKPSSTRLPNFLTEKQPKFCGAGRKSETQTKTAALPHRSLELGFDEFERQINSKTYNISLEWYVGFVSGFCLCFFLQLLQAKRKISFK